MRYRLLGPVELTVGGELVSLAQPRHRGILAYLLLHANQLVSQDQLVEAVWGGMEPASATAQIHVAVSRLRGSLRRHGLPDPIATRSGGYALTAHEDDIDAELFAAELAAARDTGQRRQHHDTIRRLDSALGLWRGEALAGVTAAYAPAVRHRLHEQRLAAQELRLDAELAVGRHAAAVPVLTQLVKEHPLREALVCQLMLALYRSGRLSDATNVARHTRQLLAEELGLGPGPQFLKLEHAILNADPVLDLTDATVGLARPPAPLPAQLPPGVPHFTGRCHELATLDAAWPGTVCVITGPAGAGKTALATHWAHQVRHSFPDGQLYLDLRGFDPLCEPLTGLESLSRLLRGLGLEAARLPGAADEATALLRSMLAQRRVLLLLDNARDAAQVRPLLPASENCAVLVTSRQPLVTLDAHRIEIGGLPQHEAAELLSHYAGSRMRHEPEAAQQMLRYCQLLPLAIRVAGARLLAEPELALQTLAAGLADERSRLDILELDDLAVRASLGASYRTLDQPTARAFRLLGVLQLPDLEVRTAAALWDLSPTAALQILHRLHAARLLERSGERYRLHDLVRLFAMERHAEGDPAEGEAALVRVATCLLGAARRATNLLRPGQSLGGEQELSEGRYANLIGLSDLDAARAWFDAERVNLIALAGQLAESGEPLCRYPMRLQLVMTMFLAGAGHFADWQHLCELSAAVARRVGDTLAEAVAAMNLGAIASRQGRQAQAVATLTRALALSRKAKRHSTEAAVLSYLASAHSELGDHDSAASCHEEAIRLRRQVGDDRSTAHTLANAALHYLVQRRYADARRHLDEALRIKYEKGDLGGAAASEVQMAGVLAAQGLLTDAVHAAQAGLDLCRRYGDRHNEWIALLLRAVAHRRLGRWRQSDDDAAECIAVCVHLGQLTAANFAAALTDQPLVGADEGDPVPAWLVSALEQAGA
ncbi:regulatory protein AfsR [Rhizocola hellebori]|uniref:Regulatory protein AfsR n=1 Tax=Rhizocola hellebori TaxID=1392758 RepID=A0A8J3QCH5_9ACTN|nr:BTAD domain-containing putative transcriptional regulator [Rhizocola hellebori]GIH08298.1 regulatory protein AfsR [Rhizocola hellebori]